MIYIVSLLKSLAFCKERAMVSSAEGMNSSLCSLISPLLTAKGLATAHVTKSFDGNCLLLSFSWCG